MVLVGIGDQPKVTETVPPDNPAVMASEDKQVASIAAISTPTKLWQGKFSVPIYLTPNVQLRDCETDWFGTPRIYSFNGSNNYYFHSGVDFSACLPPHALDIYAAAAGKVVFAGMFPVPGNEMPPRGNVTMIDNGWGVYTLYAHQSEIGVTVGQQVQDGQLIGQIGATGHVTGPHLHFEMWVNGIEVNPLDWLNNAFP